MCQMDAEYEKAVILVQQLKSKLEQAEENLAEIKRQNDIRIRQTFLKVVDECLDGMPSDTHFIDYKIALCIKNLVAKKQLTCAKLEQLDKVYSDLIDSYKTTSSNVFQWIPEKGGYWATGKQRMSELINSVKEAFLRKLSHIREGKTSNKYDV